MFKRISISLVCATLGGAVQCAAASDYTEGQWVTTFLAGTHLMGSGTLQGEASGDIADLGSLNATFAGDPASTDTVHLSMHDAFRIGPSLGIETGYFASSNLEPFARLTYSQLRGRDVQIGSLTSPALAAPGAIRADFDDQNAWALDVGTRWFANDAGIVRPYVAGFLGVNRTEPLRATVSVDGLADLGPQTLLQRETRFNGGVEGGMTVQVANQADFNVSVGANYTGARHEASDAFAPLGIESVRITDQRWSFPIDVGVNYRF